MYGIRGAIVEMAIQSMASAEAMEHNWVIMGKTVANWGIRVGSHAALLIPIPDGFARLDHGRYLSNYMPEIESWVNLC